APREWTGCTVGKVRTASGTIVLAEVMGVSRRLGDRLDPGGFLPPLADHVAIGRVELHEGGLAAFLMGGNHRRPRAAERIEHHLSCIGVIANGAGDELNRLHRRMEIIGARSGELPHAVLRTIRRRSMWPPWRPAVQQLFVPAVIIGAAENEAVFDPNKSVSPHAE